MHENLVIGRMFSDTVFVTATMVEDFARASGDRNPIHFNDEAAWRAGYERRIVHGDLVIALGNGIIAEELPGILLLSRASEFKRPVYVDSPVTITITVKDIATGRNDVAQRVEFDVKYSSKIGKLFASSSVSALHRAHRFAPT